jgi:GDP/UDP-N,N'-diacetylbacillosamine 2-epimerase (hydrolysing)
VIQKLSVSADIEMLLAVTGTHLSAEYGYTLNEIEADRFNISAKIDIMSQPVATGRLGTAQRTELALQGFTAYFAEEKPDAVLVLGDRYETFAAVQAAALMAIPVAHISGGDVTFGADDDWFRHCITKMAKLHFPTCEEYRQRVICMGEEPERVFNVGGLGDENIRSMHLLGLPMLAESLSIPLEAGPYALVTFHPETATGIRPERQVNALLGAIEQHPDLFYLFTKANADAGGEVMNQRVEVFCAANKNAVLFPSLGSLRYLSAMKYATFVLGNSSSGVVETPSFGVPCVNVGARQTGRVMSGNIINCVMETEAITQAITAVRRPAFVQQAKGVKSPYDGGDTSGKIVATLYRFLENGELARPKNFYDGEKNA